MNTAPLNLDVFIESFHSLNRVVFKHVPEKGHKRPASREDGGRFSTSMQHPAVDAFLSKVNDWLALRNNLTSEEEQL